jgi:raffinose/stachyose/melibiose transport system permease protein
METSLASYSWEGVVWMGTRRKTVGRAAFQPSGLVTAAYLLPSFILFVCMLILPLILSVGFSFFKFSSIRNFHFLGLENYSTLFNDKNVLISLKNNLFLVVVCLIGQIGIAFVLANLMNTRYIKLKRLHQTVVYFPVTLSAIVVGYVWSMVFDYNYGLIAYVLRAMGRFSDVKPWLGQPSTVMICVCIPLIWQYIGFHLVIMLSAMTAINGEIFEMAEIDGASEWVKATRRTLPLIRGTLSVCISLCISANMRVFDHIIAMTNGGPGFSSSVLAVYAYKQSFTNMNMGYGSALSVFIFGITAILFLVINRLTTPRADAV